MSTEITVSISRDANNRASAGLRDAVRRERLDAEQTRKAVGKGVDAGNEVVGRLVDDPRYASGGIYDPAAFARKRTEETGETFVTTRLVGVNITASNITTTVPDGWRRLRIRSLTATGGFGQEINLDLLRCGYNRNSEFWGCDWENYSVGDYGTTALRDAMSTALFSAAPDNEWDESTFLNQDGLAVNAGAYRSSGADWTWWGRIRLGNSSPDSQVVPSYYGSPIDNRWDGYGVYDVDPSDQFLGNFQSYSCANLRSDKWYAYLLPNGDSEAFLVVAYMDDVLGACAFYRYQWTFECTEFRSFEITNPLSSYPQGTYSASRLDCDNTNRDIIGSDSLNIGANDITMNVNDVQDRWEPIYVYKVTSSGTISEVTPPAAVISNLRKLHPSAFTGDFDTTVNYGLMDWGKFKYENDSFNNSVTEDWTRTWEREEASDAKTYAFTHPDLSEYQQHVIDTMPLYADVNRDRVLPYGYGLGELATANHGAVADLTEDRFELFKYFSPSIYSLIKGDVSGGNGYKAFQDNITESTVSVTDSDGTAKTAYAPPRYLLDVSQTDDGLLRRTKGEDYPSSLPTNVTSAVEEADLEEISGNVGDLLTNATQLCWNWGNRWYCYDQLKALGFTNTELGARPPTDLS